jgi:hypothetical protein
LGEINPILSHAEAQSKRDELTVYSNYRKSSIMGKLKENISINKAI